MFMKVKQICENQNVLVCVLIDEVESLARARDQCASGKTFSIFNFFILKNCFRN